MVVAVISIKAVATAPSSPATIAPARASAIVARVVPSAPSVAAVLG